MLNIRDSFLLAFSITIMIYRIDDINDIFYTISFLLYVLGLSQCIDMFQKFGYLIKNIIMFGFFLTIGMIYRLIDPRQQRNQSFMTGEICKSNLEKDPLISKFSTTISTFDKITD